jgi:hypothetical protein
VDFPLSGMQTVAQVWREARAVRHSSSEHLWVHSRDLEGILFDIPPLSKNGQS